MGQRVKDIHRDLIIADQFTDPHSLMQSPAEVLKVTCSSTVGYVTHTK
jgi:hypothetical protein